VKNAEQNMFFKKNIRAPFYFLAGMLVTTSGFYGEVQQTLEL
jgi:hypothetical protein